MIDYRDRNLGQHRLCLLIPVVVAGAAVGIVCFERIAVVDP
jgi:hypothetical protein